MSTRRTGVSNPGQIITIIIIACLLSLIGCGKRESTQSASVGFKIGADRAAIEKQLVEKVVGRRAEFVEAAFTLDERPMRVKLGFGDGKLQTVDYMP